MLLLTLGSVNLNVEGKSGFAHYANWARALRSDNSISEVELSADSRGPAVVAEAEVMCRPPPGYDTTT
jgi:hypothetical protein